jgi:hypothetical protein
VHPHLNRCRLLGQFDANACSTAVSQRIVHGFLCDPVKVAGDGLIIDQDRPLALEFAGGSIVRRSVAGDQLAATEGASSLFLPFLPDNMHARAAMKHWRVFTMARQHLSMAKQIADRRGQSCGCVQTSRCDRAVLLAALTIKPDAFDPHLASRSDVVKDATAYVHPISEAGR